MVILEEEVRVWRRVAEAAVDVEVVVRVEFVEGLEEGNPVDDVVVAVEDGRRLAGSGCGVE